MNFLYSIVVLPIETIVDWTFNFVLNKIDGIGVIGAVVSVSLVINFLALPLYNIADSLKDKERDIAKRLEYRANRIKKAFKGDEQFMILSEYYRQNNYHPLYSLRSSLSILIEIPFFIAAYHYLSNNEALKGASFWIFQDLGAPDELFSICLGEITLKVNLLPIIMTLINFISGLIYSKDAPFREKIQLYVISGLFLVLLYNSPSGLVIYWILNNIFSLIKNIVIKTKNPSRIVHIVISSILILFTIYVFIKHGSLYKKFIVLFFTLFVTSFYIIKKEVLKFTYAKNICFEFNNSFALLALSGVSLFLFLGFTISSSIIASSPVEFSFLGNTSNPLSYIWSTMLCFFGFFVFWPIVIYKMFGNYTKKILPAIFFILFICVLFNVYVFKCNYGNLNISFTLENEKVLKQINSFNFLMTILIFLSTIIVYYLCAKYKKVSFLCYVLSCFIIASSLLGVVKTNYIYKTYNAHSVNHKKNLTDEVRSVETIYHLSKENNNIIVLFLDRAINSFFPDILEEFPNLIKSFDGFVYYPNTLSFSTNTSLASPAMMGGYEYTPKEFNKRSNELLKDKHNESILMLPCLFNNADYNVVVSDPPWCNYAHEQDLTPFEKFPKIKAYSTFGKYTDLYFNEVKLNNGVTNNVSDIICRREIRNFIILQSLVPLARSTFYRLCLADNKRNDRNFYDIFSSLYYLDKQTDFLSKKDNYLFICSDTPHEPHIMDSEYLRISTKTGSVEKAHYDVNVATMLQVKKYLDYLRENGAYDNSRIIIVADHGANLKLKSFNGFSDGISPSAYNPLLLVKDFNSKGKIKIDNSFMTNADTPLLALENLSISKINPFTNKKIVSAKTDAGIIVYPLANGEHHADHLLKKTKFTLNDDKAFIVNSNIFNESNWIPLINKTTGN